MKRVKIYLSIGCVLLAIGLVLVLYAPVSNKINSKHMKDITEAYDDNLNEMYEDTDTSELYNEIERINSENPDTDYTVSDYVKDNNIEPNSDSDAYNWALISLLREEMEEYNRSLLTDGQYLLNDPFAFEQPSFELYSYGINDNIFGHIDIPAIDMDLPIYLGANLENMSLGAVHLSYSSMPIGGDSTNTVLAGHRGVVGTIYFDNIVFLEEGDDVYITNFWDKLHYRVISYEVISPYDIERCYIQEGKELLTLLTCHPYGYTDYRYMVVCERVYDD